MASCCPMRKNSAFAFAIPGGRAGPLVAGVNEADVVFVRQQQSHRSTFFIAS